MSLDPPTYLSSLQNNIRARPVPWEGSVRAGTLTDQALKKIKAVDKVRKEQRKQTIEGNYDSYKSLLLGGEGEQSVFEAAVGKGPHIVQYMLVLTGDLMNDAPDFASELLEHPDPYKPFLPLLNHGGSPEEPIRLLASSVLATLIGAAEAKFPKSNPKQDEALSKLYAYLAGLTKGSDSGLQDIAVQAQSNVLRTKKARELFWQQRADTVAPLFDILRTAAGASRDGDSSTVWSSAGGSSSARGMGGGLGEGVGIQLLYHVLLVIWQLSFEASLVGEGLEKEQEIIPLYTQLLRLSPKEKTTRLLLSTLLNLLDANRSALLPVAVSARVDALLETLKGRHLSDEDLLEDLKALVSMFDEYTSSQTTFDSYADEVLAGHLRWSPPHRNGAFWAENARRVLEDNKGQLPRKLAEILGKSWEGDKAVLAVACNDVAWLVKSCPEKREALEKLGIKGRIMELMQDSNEAVRWESLRAVGEWLRYSFE